MTERRAADLSYGHVGEASYDIDDIHWNFSADHVGSHVFQQLLPFSVFELPSFQTAPSAQVQPSNLSRSQARYFVKTRPETFSANPFFAPFSRDAKEWQETPAISGGLFSVGGAIDVQRQPGYRTEPVIAIPHGEAGHVLQLIMPGSERHGWQSKSSVSVSMMSSKASDYGHWVGTGGTIHQIVFADEGNVASTWLAVRQAFMTTIFRPMYDSVLQPAIVPMGYGQMYPPSRLSPNPVATLTIERTKSKKHADVSFNPYYTRQFAVVDDVGSWSIWDIEGRVRNESSLELIPGKSGQIYDGYTHDPSLKTPNSADGWHRILWAGNVSTIIICNRRHISVFDLKSAPTRLQGPEILAASSTDWIRDVKRSLQNSSHVFILTSSRIFWVEVIPAAEDKEKYAGIRTILSYRHFLDSNDDSLKVTVLRGTEVLVLVSSGKSSLVKFYNFSTASDDNKTPTSYHGAFTISKESNNNKSLPGNEALQCVHFIQASVSVARGISRGPGSDFDYLERNVKFFQAFLFSSSYGLKAGLCSAQCVGSGPPIPAPDTRRILATRRPKTNQQVDDDAFIVPDRALDEPFSGIAASSLVNLHNRPDSRLSDQEDPRLKLNWAPIFNQIFTMRSADPINGADSLNSMETVSSLLDQISSHIQAGKDNGNLPRTSFFELARAGGISEELEQVSPILEVFFEMFRAHQDSDSTQDFVLSDLTSCPGVKFHTNENRPSLNLLQVYDRIGDHWLASLPLEVSNITRLAKFKAARKLAVELYLSSVAVSIRDKSSHMEEPVVDESGTMSLRPVLNNDSATLGYGSSQMTEVESQEPASSLPNPARSPNLQSSELAASREPLIDPAILRLRQYAVSIAQPSGIGSSALLFLWPSSPGADPSNYTWKSGPSGNDGGADERYEHKRRRDESRRRKKTAKFLSGGIPIRPEASSQPAFPPFGSQPEIPHQTSSSQVINEQPMTQPDRGLFGSRSLISKNKKPKKRRAAGF